MKKIAMLAAAATTLGLASVVGISSVSAQNTNGDTLIDKIATRFNLNRDEVQAVFNENRAEHEAEREENRSEHLQELVDIGTITAEQKSALEAKFTDMQTAREALRDQDLTHDEMHTKMQEIRGEFESWAEEQGIDLSAIRPDGGEHRHGRHHRHGDMEDSPDSNSNN